MHSTDNPPNTRLGVNNWLVIGEDGQILDTRVMLYCVRGTVKETLEFLESRIPLDFYVAEAIGPPELRFDRMVDDADDYPPAPPIYFNDPRLEANWCLLFGHATTLRLMNLPAVNFLEFEGDANAVYLAKGFILQADETLSPLDLDLSGFVNPLPPERD